MRKKTTRIIALMLVVVLAFSTSAAAASTRASSHLVMYSAYAVPDGNGNFNIKFYVTGKGIMTMIGAKEIEVFTVGGQSVETFSYHDEPSMMGYSVGSHAWSVLFDEAESGQTYYAVVTFYAMNSSGSDTKTYTTSTF